MKKSRIQILVVEDDATQGKALEEAFKRDGYSVTLATTSVQAITLAQRQEFHCLLVDCMLPKMNGIDLVTEILAMVPNKPKVYLFSGIYKDREFTREAMRKTGAVQFFMKPLELPAILASVETAFVGSGGDEDAPSILRIYSSDALSDEELSKLIENESTLHAFHLPMLYQRLLDTSLSGELSMISADGEVCSVMLYNGKVSSVRTPDKDTFFGSLAVSLGFVDAQEVIQALKDPQATQLGMKLVDSMSLSPHAIDVILAEQMALRLSQTVRGDVLTLQWVAKKMPKPHATLALSKFESMVEDWLDSKLTEEWVKSTLMSWGSFQIEGDYHPRLHGPRALRDVLSDPAFSEDKDMPGLFRALVRGRAFIGARIAAAPNFSFLEARIDQMARDYKHQNLFQVLGVSDKAGNREVLRSFEGLQEAFDPKNLPPECPADLHAKCVSVFATITRARDVLTDDAERMRYVQNLQTKRNQEMLEAEPIFRTAILELLSGHVPEAAKKFQNLLDRKLEFKDLRAYRVWAGLKVDRGYSKLRLDQIPPEERHSAPYLMAKGISYRSRGHFKKAIDAFRTAHMLDPRLRASRTELKLLLAEMNNNRSHNRELIKEGLAVLETLPKSKRAA